MSQREIEVILMRQLASYLAMPIFIVDPDGTLVFYNEPAEKVLGQRFEETGEMSLAEWARADRATDDVGNPVPLEERPLLVALREQRPVHGWLWLRGFDDVRRCIEGTAFPLIGHAGRSLGAVVIFWETHDECA
jgi:PAS domain-containing protein